MQMLKFQDEVLFEIIIEIYNDLKNIGYWKWVHKDQVNKSSIKNIIKIFINWGYCLLYCYIVYETFLFWYVYINAKYSDWL